MPKIQFAIDQLQWILQNSSGGGDWRRKITERIEYLMPKNVLSGVSTWKICKHNFFSFKHWFRTFFICKNCQSIFSKKQIKEYKKLKEKLDKK